VSEPPAGHPTPETARHAQRSRRSLPLPREWPITLILLGVVASLLVVALNHFRRGTVLLALFVLLAGALRLVLPAREAGLLAVRSRVIDVLTLSGLGAALLFFALIVPPPS
jgi:Protein of unknown function (DUF3017)